MNKLFIFLFLFGCSIPPLVIASELLTVTVLAPDISQAVSFVSKGGYNVSFRLVCVNASADTVIDKLFSEGFNLGDSANEFRERIGKKMQDEIDIYQEKHTVFSSSAYNNSSALIEAGLDGGV